MPLPSQKYGAKQCSARSKRSGVRCLNNTVSTSNVCRMHGYVPKDKVKRGEQHPNYVHGGRTLEAQLKQSSTSRKLQQIEDAMHLLGMTTAKRSRGRKANGYRKIRTVEKIIKTIS
jgi:hypothetical protein